MAGTFVLPPGSKLDYVFDWSDWLADSELITDYTITVETGLTLDSDELDSTEQKVVVWLSGGELHEMYRVQCDLVTSPLRETSRIMLINCEHVIQT